MIKKSKSAKSLWKKPKRDPANIRGKSLKGKIRNISLYLLESIIYAVDDLSNVGSILVDRKSVYKVAYQGWHKNSDLAKKICNYLQDLRYRELIEIKKSESSGNDIIILTNKAKLRVVDKISAKIKSDRKYRFLSFDVPEVIRVNRNRFRKAIKAIGFRQVHKSLWVIDKNVSDLVEMAAYECKVEKYVAYIVSEKSDIDGIVDKIISDK
jgi:hypothetical protein